MLFVSRSTGYSSFGIVDTDDWDETVLHVYDLRQLYKQQSDIEIKGITVDAKGHIDVIPYQHPSFCTTLQVKLSVLYGVDITTYRNMITGIRLRHGLLREPLRLRLSDFGDTLAGDTLYKNRHTDDRMLTLVLDDKLSVSSQCFSLSGEKSTGYNAVGWRGIGMRFDLRQVKSEEKVNVIYNSLLPLGDLMSNYKSISRDIIDWKDRRDRHLRARLTKGI